MFILEVFLQCKIILTAIHMQLYVIVIFYDEYVCTLFGDEFLAQGLHLKSLQRCSAGIRTWLSADQSRSSTLTESSFIFDLCLIHRDTVMLEYKRVLSTLLLKK